MVEIETVQNWRYFRHILFPVECLLHFRKVVQSKDEIFAEYHRHMIWYNHQIVSILTKKPVSDSLFLRIPRFRQVVHYTDQVQYKSLFVLNSQHHKLHHKMPTQSILERFRLDSHFLNHELEILYTELLNFVTH